MEVRHKCSLLVCKPPCPEAHIYQATVLALATESCIKSVFNNSNEVEVGAPYPALQQTKRKPLHILHLVLRRQRDPSVLESSGTAYQENIILNGLKFPETGNVPSHLCPCFFVTRDSFQMVTLYERHLETMYIPVWPSIVSVLCADFLSSPTLSVTLRLQALVKGT